MRKVKIRKFEDFVTEQYHVAPGKSLSDVLLRFYMLVRKPFPTTSEKVLGKMIGSVRNTLFDQLSVDSTNCMHLPLQPGIPILNFTEDNDLVQKMLDEDLIDRGSLYNDPSQSLLVSDKVTFHKTFQESLYVPKTVYTVKDASSLAFPIIAKPAQGKSAEGIMKFENHEDLISSDKEFDVFCETIDIAREFRCFCFRDDVMEVNERIKIEGSEDFLLKADTKTDFYYKKVDYNTPELKTLLEDCRKRVQLDFYSVDFAETSNGQLFIIEMNSRTGMGVDKMVELYTRVHRDFFKKAPSDVSLEKMDQMVSSWKTAYEKNKGENSVNECTTVAGHLDGSRFLFKNRDRSYTPDTVIVHENFKGTEIVYYTDQTGWIEGMNEHGVGFVFSQLTGKERNGYGPSWRVSDEPKNSGKFDKFAKGVKEIFTAKDAREAMKLLEKSEKSGSFLMGDPNEIYEIEVFEGDTKSRKLDFDENPYYVKSNHGVLIPHAGHQPSGYSIKRASSEIRKHQAETQLKGIQDLSEIPTRMKTQVFDSGSSLNVFRTDAEEYTISQCMMDLTNLKFYFFHDPSTADSIKVENSAKNSKITVTVKTV
jgi:hypothetical protein